MVIGNFERYFQKFFLPVIPNEHLQELLLCRIGIVSSKQANQRCLFSSDASSPSACIVSASPMEREMFFAGKLPQLMISKSYNIASFPAACVLTIAERMGRNCFFQKYIEITNAQNARTNDALANPISIFILYVSNACISCGCTDGDLMMFLDLGTVLPLTEGDCRN